MLEVVCCQLIFMSPYIVLDKGLLFSADETVHVHIERPISFL